MDDCTPAAEVNYICDHLVMNILSRLPPKTLFICKCVSKSWHHMASTLIDPPKRPRLRPLIGLFVSSDNDPYDQSIEFYSRRDDDGINVNYSLNFLRMLPDTILVGCQDGHLLCSSPNEYLVCNPITRQWVSLPRLREHRRRQLHAKLVLDEESDSCYSHFKIVQVEEFPWRLRSCAVDVYCSQTGKWRESKALKLKRGSQVYFWEKPSVHLDGVVFFSGSFQSLIYDIKEDCWEELPLPIELHEDICMGKSEGRLHYAYPIRSQIRVWMMVGGGTSPTARQWVLKHSICVFDIDFPHCSRWHRANIYAFHPNSDAIFIRKRGGDLFCYNINTKALEKAATEESDWTRIGVYPFSDCLRPLVDAREMTQIVCAL